MQTYYVATVSRYVLVDADTEQTAREAGLVALAELYRQDGHELHDIGIRIVRLATADEVQLRNWHDAERKLP